MADDAWTLVFPDEDSSRASLALYAMTLGCANVAEHYLSGTAPEDLTKLSAAADSLAQLCLALAGRPGPVPAVTPERVAEFARAARTDAVPKEAPVSLNFDDDFI